MMSSGGTPPNHYVLVDDKLRILTTVKRTWRSRVTTVFPRQGQYAHDQENYRRMPACRRDRRAHRRSA